MHRGSHVTPRADDVHNSRKRHDHDHGQRRVIGHELVEDENSRREDELKGKIGALKSLTIEIGHVVRDHNRLLRSVDDDFDSAGGLLQKSMAKVLALARSGSRYHLLYLFFFCLFVFVVIWLLK